ncbi:carboxypeptidase-like regulatory domain-containing protein [Cellulophaga sp. 20_2_10]|uniref:carboxypeptidase-like regulatory domain-containing protein n=1 Tax=Cellulophaga sp. 20_2_10 TaxID=2942476 RepID=UPI00201A3A0D|nr:carboxypeptidase-like regulatory domain-containing protein [Cellulophaga sp. 20_2_10]MCL5244346.1 carboxypeptidase-like regulatory domain-containing protein [Cellulophaga sp. 20_2_10]
MKFKYILSWVVFLIYSPSILAQDNIVVKGKVTDSLQQPIANATLLAKPQEEKAKVVYAITDKSGFYTLQLLKNEIYKISISHLGYNAVHKTVTFTEENSNYNIQLTTKVESLDEVVINYKYQPIEKNKDTITYNLDAFTNGNEFKMIDVLNKLPGISVEDSSIKVQGKTVTKLLVEGKPFFDGSTKLAIENIPADVMAKIEIISDYKESKLLRNLADNEDLALNVVLKEDKKDFAFGDIEAGLGFNDFYSVHSALFKYNPKSNISFIGDINNFNNSSISISDLSRLVGGTSNLFKRSNLSRSLLSFAGNNQERFESTTRFSALNFQKELNHKLNMTGYVIYSNNDIANKSASVREYIGEESIFETRNDFGKADNRSTLVNLKLDYNPNKKQKWIYNINYLNSNSDYFNESISNVETTNQFLTKVKGSNGSFTQNLEGYFKLNDKHTMGVALYHNVINSNSTDNWFSNAIFLDDFLPVTETTDYQLNQKNDLNSQNFNFLIKDYWLANRYFHLFYHVGYNYKNSRYINDISQIFPDNSSSYFSELSNNNPVILSDFNSGLGVKTKTGKVEFIVEAKPHYYSFERAQVKSTNFFIEPKFSAKYKIEDDIDLDFEYNYANNYLNDTNYLRNLKITGFSSLAQGNPNLEDERSHNFSLYYSNYKNIDNFFIDASIDYSIMNPVKNNSIIQSGINQLSTPILLNLPENNLSFNTELGLIFGKTSLDFGVDLDWLKFNQVINEDITSINSFEYGLSSKLRMKLNKKTQLNLKYKHNGYNVNSDEDSRSTEDIFSLDFDSKFLKNFIFKTDFSTHLVKDFSDKNQNYTLQNLYLGYTKPNSKFSYGIKFNNIYNNGIIVRTSFRNNLFSSNQIFTLPRVFLFELKYKF